MDVGKPVRTHEVEPVEDPVPRRKPGEETLAPPGNEPAPVEAPAR